MEAMVCFSKNDTDFFKIVNRVLKEETYAPFQFLLFSDYTLRSSLDPIKMVSYKKREAIPIVISENEGRRDGNRRTNQYHTNYIILILGTFLEAKGDLSLKLQ